MLMPKRVKYRKVQRGRMKGRASRGTTITYGQYGLEALEPSWITANQIEAARRAMNRSIRRGGDIYTKIFPDKSVTRKPAETRMGSGKGSPEYWVAVVKPGRILFEMGGVPESVAREAMRLGAMKLPIKTRFVKKEDVNPDGEKSVSVSMREFRSNQLSEEEYEEVFEKELEEEEKQKAEIEEARRAEEAEDGGTSED